MLGIINKIADKSDALRYVRADTLIALAREAFITRIGYVAYYIVYFPFYKYTLNIREILLEIIPITKNIQPYSAVGIFVQADAAAATGKILTSCVPHSSEWQSGHTDHVHIPQPDSSFRVASFRMTTPSCHVEQSETSVDDKTALSLRGAAGDVGVSRSRAPFVGTIHPSKKEILTSRA